MCFESLDLYYIISFLSPLFSDSFFNEAVPVTFETGGCS